jgi:hypothetical protein
MVKLYFHSPYVLMAYCLINQTLNAQSYKPEQEGEKEQWEGGRREVRRKGK